MAAFSSLALAFPAAASGQSLEDPVNQWLPASDGASWTYEWWDSKYSPERTRERYTLTQRVGDVFRLGWTTSDLGNGEGTVQSEGYMDYKRTTAGLVNTNWASSPPPPQFPILCASASRCGNSLAGTHFMAIWGTRSPVLAEPLLDETRWSSLGGANDDSSSSNRYAGRQRVFTPAFPQGVEAAKIESDVTQAGALGDPYGSGVRTVWWVYGVGPVKIGFRHAGGEVSEAELMETTLKPLPAPPDANYLPLNRGDTMTFRWRNNRHMPRSSTQRFTVSEVVNNTSRVDVKHVSGPISVTGGYVMASRLSGVTNLSTFTRSASRARFPALGPRSQPRAGRRRLVTPFDFMAFGYNPVLPAYPKAGDTWTHAKTSRDYRVYGVTGRTKILGTRRVRVRAGSFRALVVQSDLRQNGFRYGSGRRTSWFAPGKGLVKLVFRHRDGSVSTVERVR